MKAGFTIVELMFALLVFAVIGYALLDTVLMADHSQDAVIGGANDNRGLREASGVLVEELRLSSDARLVVVDLIDGNRQVTFQEPIGAAGWGVEDPAVAGGLAQDGWSLRYTVVDVAQPAGVDRQLVRRILDAAGATQHEEVLLRGLSQELGTPGFTIEQSGDVWAVALALEAGGEGSHDGRDIDFNFRTRN